MTAKSRQRHDTLDLLPFLLVCVFLPLRRNDTLYLYLFLFSSLMKVDWTLCIGVCFFLIVISIYDNEFSRKGFLL